MLHGKLELLVGRAEVHHQVERLVDHLFGAGALAVDLVDADHDREVGVDGVTQDEARLGHGALGGVDEKDRAVGHPEHALDLAAEVGVAGGVDDVDLDALVLDGDVLRQDGDAALALLVVGVEHALLYLLVLAERVRCLEHLVHEGGLAVVDVGDDGDVPDVLLAHVYLSFERACRTHTAPARLILVFPSVLYCTRGLRKRALARHRSIYSSGFISPAGAGSVHRNLSRRPLPSTSE